MKEKVILLAGLLGATLPGLVRAQAPEMPATRGAAAGPVVYARVAGPHGLITTFFQGDVAGRRYDAPVTVGLRPGYMYQIQISGLPKRPDLPGVERVLNPTIEVRGTLALPPGSNAPAYPVPVVFTAEDIARAQDGALVTKVVYLENPERAQATSSSLDRPLEIEARGNRDSVAEARSRGRLMLIVRIGARQSNPEELAGQSIPGTILFPGEHGLHAAAQGPPLAFTCWQLYDPRSGPRGFGEEKVCDGGDVGARAGIGPDGKLHGLDPTDTVAEFTDVRGKRKVSVSNRVCLYAPRFAVIRSETAPAGLHVATGIAAKATAVSNHALEGRQARREALQEQQVMVAAGRERTSGTQNSQGIIAIDELRGPVTAVARQQGAEVTGVLIEKEAQPTAKPLVLWKWADRPSAQVGELVTFQLKYSNYGGQPINSMVISDSLSGRLEYVAGTAKADREAAFTVEANQAGSAILRWEMAGQLLPGQSGLLTFQAKVR